jgi:hypothetical protein
MQHQLPSSVRFTLRNLQHSSGHTKALVDVAALPPAARALRLLPAGFKCGLRIQEPAARQQGIKTAK